ERCEVALAADGDEVRQRGGAECVELAGRGLDRARVEVGRTEVAGVGGVRERALARGHRRRSVDRGLGVAGGAVVAALGLAGKLEHAGLLVWRRVSAAAGSGCGSAKRAGGTGS